MWWKRLRWSGRWQGSWLGKDGVESILNFKKTSHNKKPGLAGFFVVEELLSERLSFVHVQVTPTRGDTVFSGTTSILLQIKGDMFEAKRFQ